MTETLLQKLEEKIMVCLSEIEELRQKVDRLTAENNGLKIDREAFEKKVEAKLKELIGLFDTIGVEDTSRETPKPMLVQA